MRVRVSPVLLLLCRVCRALGWCRSCVYSLCAFPLHICRPFLLTAERSLVCVVARLVKRVFRWWRSFLVGLAPAELLHLFSVLSLIAARQRRVLAF